MNQDIERLERQLIANEKKSIKVHLLYWAIIFLLLGVFLILLAPGSVNPRAFENFSFASTIVSIVLAVVSIIYSFTVGKNTGDNMVGIREIERSIDTKLERFDTWKDQILDGVRSITNPIGEEVGRLREDQTGFRNEMARMMSGFSSKTEPSPSGNKELPSTKIGRTAFYGNIAMYVSLLSKKKNRPFDFNKFGVNISVDYAWGFMEACSAVFPASFSYSGSEHEFTIRSFDEKVLGDEAFWRDRVLGFSNKEEAKSYLDAINRFFDNDSAVADDTQK